MSRICKSEVEEPRTKEAPSWWVINYPEDEKREEKDYTGEIIAISFFVFMILMFLVIWDRFGKSGLFWS